MDRWGHNEIFLSRKVTSIKQSSQSIIVITEKEEFESKHLVNCAGLYSDKVTAMTQRIDSKIVPFRGEYYEIIPEKRYLCKNLIYPVPDQNLPFLGVHFTRMIDGSVECGPNAVLAFAREGYKLNQINIFFKKKPIV